MLLRNIAIACALGAALSSCASYQPPSPAFHRTLSEPYRLDSGDRVRVTVFEQDALTNSYAVDKGGFIAMPLIGSVPARGHTTEELEKAVADRLRNGFLRDPSIAAEVETYRPFFIMGEVTQGGQYSYVPGLTVQKAIAIAGGFTARAEQRNADLTRQVNGKIETGRVLVSDPIQPGDTIFVRERWF
ncbi:sugar ABC transporter substrate-binding protein [Aureimonas endophytica]|uniref:Sugar ABC transporter substrate-binding protein n=1 Tax=Aureimonas endophytica TaxID=2027858 RepID=A0A916ZC86_9HYPH|nr:polysaccharide biosynthesis/export family protein [Aureimonas endophytica]GGD86099.1 sugar ABC transporter substrate-binding protein [Aureimonas endophytica]